MNLSNQNTPKAKIPDPNISSGIHTYDESFNDDHYQMCGDEWITSVSATTTVEADLGVSKCKSHRKNYPNSVLGSTGAHEIGGYGLRDEVSDVGALGTTGAHESGRFAKRFAFG